MAKYLILWELDDSRVPVDADERSTMWEAMADTVKQDIEDGKTTDWGCFVGETKGYAVIDQNDVIDITKGLQRFYPFVTFQVHQVMSVEQMTEVAESMTE